MPESDIQKFALLILKAFEHCLIRYATLKTFLAENRIEVPRDDLDQFLKGHPQIAQDIHRDCEPLFAAIGENADFQSALEVLRDMSVKGRIQ